MAGLGLAKKGLGLLGKRKKGDLLMKNFKKRLKKIPNKTFREDKSYTLMKGTPHAKTYQHITSGKKQKKKILQQHHASKRSFEATGHEWAPYKGAWKAKGGRIGFAEGKYVDSEYYKQKQKRKQATEVKDVTGKVIPVEKRPHSTYEGRSAERRRGYRRESKKWHEQAATESQGRNRRTHLGVIRNKGGKV